MLPGQPLSFGEKIYPILENAGCRNCHNVEDGRFRHAASFPDRECGKGACLDAFGKSLAEFINRQNPANSLLLRKPTLRMQHRGHERSV